MTFAQLHQRGWGGRPPIRLNWENGKLTASVMETNVANSKRYKVVIADHVPLGQKFNYKMNVLSDGSVGIDVNGKTTKVKLDSSFNKSSLFFKAGAYVHADKQNRQGAGKVTYTGLQMT